MDGYRTQTNDVKNRFYILVSAGMVLPAAFLFYVVAELPHVFLIACLGFLISLLIKKPLQYTDRSIIYSVVISLVLVILLDLIFPMKPDRFFHIGRIFRPNITVPLAIYLAVFATFYESSNYTLGFNASFSLIAILLGGDFRGATPMINSEGFFSFLLTKKNFIPFFMTVGVVNILMILTAFNLARKSLFHRSHCGIDKKKILTTGGALIITALLALGMFSLFNAYKREIMRLEHYLRYLRYKGPSNPSAIMFDREIDLNNTIKADRKQNSRMIMVRVAGCDNPPGYLRGRAYQFYSNGKWRETAEPTKNTKFNINVDGLAINAFFIDKDPGDEGESVNIYPSSTCYANFLFLPGNTTRIEMVADRVDYTINGTFTPILWEKDAGYTARIEKVDQFAAFLGPVDFMNSKYLLIPSNLSYTSFKILKEIYGLAPLNDITTESDSIERYMSNTLLTDRQITQKLVTFFNNKFKYTLEPEVPPLGQEPLEHFMTETRNGHCELFASSTAMLLRKLGIPTRYVTGLICHEVHPSGKYFVSRLGDAHAWVEAYLPDEKKWIVVESTPAAPDDIKPEWGFFEVWIDRLKHSFQKIFADIRRGYVARAVVSAVVEFFSLFLDFIKHPLGGALFILSLLLIIWRYKFYKKGDHRLKLKLDKQILAIQKKMQRLETHIEKKTGILRKSHITVGEWLDNIKKSQTLSNETFNKFSDLVKLYQKLRFSTDSISDKAIVSLDHLISECKYNEK